jgi:PAS domain S-box-containing protein
MHTGSETLEVVRLKQVEQELNARLRQQEAVAQLGQRALVITDLNSLMDEAVKLTAQTLDVPLCKVLEITGPDEDLLLIAGVGWREGAVGNVRVRAGQSQAGYTLLASKPVIVEDLKRETRFSGYSLLDEHGVISGMSVIIRGKDQPYGVLSVHTREKRRFSPDDAHFLHSIANVLVSSVVRFRSEDVLRSSRDQMAIILQGVSDGVTVQDTTGKLVYTNTTAARMLGFSSEQALLNASAAEIVSKFEIMNEAGEPLPLNMLPSRKALSGQGESSAIIRFRIRESGEERWSNVTSSPVHNNQGQVELAVNIFKDITEYVKSEHSRQLLAEAGSLFSSTLDVSTTLKNVVQLAVTHLADWCVVNTLEEDNSIKQFIIAHAHSDKVDLASELQNHFPSNHNSDIGLGRVLRSGEPEYFPEITDDLLRGVATSDEHFQRLRQLNLSSAMILPLIARGRILGALTLIWADSGRKYSQSDLVMAEELARLSALALDNARLYSRAQELNLELEVRVNKRTDQLQTTINKLKSEISERKKSEKARRSSEKMLAGMFEAAPDATVLVNSDGLIERVNAQVEHLFGYNRDELIGKKVEVLLPERYRGVHTFHRQEYFSELRTRPMGAGLDLYGRRKDGSEFPLDIMLSPVDVEGGPYVIGAIRDITERKQMEAELSEVQSRLLESVEAERLYIAQELHDGPIQELYGVGFVLKSLENENHDLNGDLSQVYNQIQGVVKLLRTICSDLRPPSLAPFGLEKAIQTHADQFREAHPDIKLDLDLTPDGQLLPERVRLGLYRIYQHAISNVVRHSKADWVAVHFSIDSEKVELSIQDDGCGFEIPKKWVELARKGHLGLVGTAERAEAIGGSLQIITAPGKGSTIRVIIPQNQTEENIFFGSLSRLSLNKRQPG